MFGKATDLAKTHAFSALAFSIFGLMFAMRPATWLPTLILLVCAVAAIFSAAFRRKALAIASDNELRWIVAPFVTWFVVCWYVGLWHWGLAKYAFSENPFRIFLALGSLGLTVHASSKKSFIAGLLVASVCVVLNVFFGYLIHDEYFPRIRGTTNHPIHFGNFSALLLVMLVTAAALSAFASKSIRYCCLISASFAFIAMTASMTRSSFVVLICLVPVFFASVKDRLHRQIISIAVVGALLLCLSVLISPRLQEKLRINEAASDIQQVEISNYGNSIGARLSMWRSAWLIFTDNPLLGIGPARFDKKFAEMISAGDVPKTEIFNQPHNDILNAASTGGVLKLLAYLLLMFGPFVFFYKKYQANKNDLDKRMLPIMGMQVVVGFFLTGLTNSNFDLQIYSTTYAVLVCVLAQLILFEQRRTA